MTTHGWSKTPVAHCPSIPTSSHPRSLVTRILLLVSEGWSVLRLLCPAGVMLLPLTFSISKEFAVNTLFDAAPIIAIWRYFVFCTSRSWVRSVVIPRIAFRSRRAFTLLRVRGAGTKRDYHGVREEEVWCIQRERHLITCITGALG